MQTPFPMIKPIKTEAAYESALARAYALMQGPVEAGSPESDELELLSLLISAWEAKHYPLPPPHPLDAIRFRVEQLGLSEAELARILGGRSRKSEILSGRRKLSLRMIRRLNEQLGIPAETLIQAY